MKTKMKKAQVMSPWLVAIVIGLVFLIILIIIVVKYGGDIRNIFSGIGTSLRFGG